MMAQTSIPMADTDSSMPRGSKRGTWASLLVGTTAWIATTAAATIGRFTRNTDPQ